MRHMRRRIHASYEEEDSMNAFASYEEEDNMNACD